MRNPSVGVVVESTLGAADCVAMSIDPSGMAHVMSVLTHLYSDAPLAVLREYTTNARDSHVAAGVSRPIEVRLPSDLEPTLLVRDFGVGLSEAEIVNVYARYGASTKRDSDEQIGAFGLGSKSAFTLGPQFVVTGVRDGQQTAVLFALGADGVGGVTVLHRGLTTEGNGVSVAIGVSEVAALRRIARRFFATWPTGSVLVDGQEPATVWADALPINDAVVAVSPDDPVAELGLHLVMGGVSYPVPEQLINRAANRADLQRVGHLVVHRRCSIYSHVAIGAVDITPSREALRDTDRTVQEIRSVLRCLHTEVAAAVGRRMDAEPTPAAAAWFLAGVGHRLGALSERLPVERFGWRGAPLPRVQQVPLPCYRLNTDKPRRMVLSCQDITAVDLFAIGKVLVVTDVPSGAPVQRAARKYLVKHHPQVDVVVVSPATTGQWGWFAFGPGHRMATMTYPQFRQATDQIPAQSRPAASVSYLVQQRPETSCQVTAEYLGALSCEVIAFTWQEAQTPLGRRVGAGRAAVTLTGPQTFAALAKRVPGALEGSPLIDRAARELLDRADPGDLALLAAQQLVTARRAIMERIYRAFGSWLDGYHSGPFAAFLAEFTQARQLVAAEPTRAELLADAARILRRPAAAEDGEQLVRRRFPLLHLGIRACQYHQCFTQPEAQQLLTHLADPQPSQAVAA